MKTIIIAVRHGETEWNKIEKQQGQLNSNLSENGIAQAEALALGLKNYQIDTFYSSDLGRAVQTSEFISQAINKTFSTDESLRERHLGVMQGLTKMEFLDKYPQEADSYKSKNPDYKIPEGESIRERFERCVNSIENMVQANAGKSILIVAHGGVLMSMIQKTFGLPLDGKRAFSILNGSINIFSISEHKVWKLESWGIVDHLISSNLEVLDDN